MIFGTAQMLGALFILRQVSDADSTLGTHNSGRIVGGRTTSHEFFPYIVSIQKQSSQQTWSHNCGGSIINPYWILTACHCVANTKAKPLRYKDTTKMRIVAGVTNWKQDGPERQEVGVKATVAHPKCGRGGLFHPYTYYDAGLIQLKTPLEYSPQVQPLKFFSKDRGKAVGELRRLQDIHTICESPGWGRIQQVPKIQRSPALKAAYQTLHTASECHEILCHGKQQTEGKCSDLNRIEQVCVVSNNASVCNGDSGGPLVCGGFVFGVVSQVGSTCTFGGMQIFSGIGSILNIINKYVTE